MIRFARKLFHRDALLPLAASISICGLVFTAFAYARERGALFRVEALVYDQFLKWFPRPTESPCAIVAVTESNIQKWGDYPISDYKLAQLLRRLQKAEPVAIGIDIFREFPKADKHHSDVDGTKLLDEALTDPACPVVAGYRIVGRVAPPPAVADMPERIAFLDVYNDADHIARQGLLFMVDPAMKPPPGEAQPDPVYSLAAQLADHHFGNDDAKREKLATALRWSRPRDLMYVPAATGEVEPDPLTGAKGTEAPQQTTSVNIDFRGPALFDAYDVESVMENDATLEKLRGRIILVGVIASSVIDQTRTPVNDRLPGVMFHATVCDQLLRMIDRGQSPTRSLPESWEYAISLLFGLSGGAIGWPARWAWPRLGVLATLGAVLIAGAWLLLFKGSLYFPVVGPAVNLGLSCGLVTAFRLYRERENRNLMNQIVDRIMSRRVASAIWSRRAELLKDGHLKPQEHEATVLFSDLQGFTELSEHLPPPVLLKWLNEYFQRMSDQVEKHGGVVNKYVGDSIMAVFGAPLQSPDQGDPEISRADARRGVACAIAMREELDRFRRTWGGTDPQHAWSKAELDPLRAALALIGGKVCVRIGMTTGRLVLGTLGSKDRLEYTVIGDSVNLASRLEGWDKDRMEAEIAGMGCRIIVDQRTQELLANEFEFKCLGTQKIRGRDAAANIYAVTGCVLSRTGDH